MLEWATNKLLSDKTTEKPQVSILEFVPSQAGYQFDHVNIKSSKSHHKKKKSELDVSLHFLVILCFVNEIVSKIYEICA